MARATLDDMVVRFKDGEYRCKMKRVPSRTFADLAKRKAEVDKIDESGDDDAAEQKANLAVDVLMEIADTCISEIDCGEDGIVAIDALDIPELVAIAGTAMDFTAAQMNQEISTRGNDSASSSEPSDE